MLAGSTTVKRIWTKGQLLCFGVVERNGKEGTEAKPEVAETSALYCHFVAGMWLCT